MSRADTGSEGNYKAFDFNGDSLAILFFLTKVSNH